MAMGGQGGGVLVDWIVALIEGQGWLAQSTSVPGVAQRTGATIYYVEAIESDGSGRRPVLSLMPVPGEVDIVIGAELMEAGRAMQRGLVSPDRTTLIASSHRAYAVSEKIAPGDGAGDPAKVHEAARAASKQFLAFDMAAIAEQSESVISAALVRRAGGLRRPAVPARRLRGDHPRGGRRRRGEPACLRPRLRCGRGGAQVADAGATGTAARQKSSPSCSRSATPASTPWSSARASCPSRCTAWSRPAWRASWISRTSPTGSEYLDRVEAFAEMSADDAHVGRGQADRARHGL